MFVLTVTDSELTTVRLVTPSLDVAIHHRDLLVDSEYADLDFRAIDGNPLRLAILDGPPLANNDDEIARVEIHTGVETA